jgi:hypothetical protein
VAVVAWIASFILQKIVVHNRDFVAGQLQGPC